MAVRGLNNDTGLFAVIVRVGIGPLLEGLFADHHRGGRATILDAVRLAQPGVQAIVFAQVDEHHDLLIGDAFGVAADQIVLHSGRCQFDFYPVGGKGAGLFRGCLCLFHKGVSILCHSEFSLFFLCGRYAAKFDMVFNQKLL